MTEERELKSDADSIHEQKVSIEDVLTMSKSKLETTVFVLHNEDLKEEMSESNQNPNYVQLKVKEYENGNKRMKLFQIVDVTNYILYTEFKA